MSNESLSDITARLRDGGDLDASTIRVAVGHLLDEDADLGDRADFLAALRAKGETPDEIAALVECLLGHARDPGIEREAVGGPLLEVCGTGGDKLSLFNISTAVMFVAAACGASVVKHGNRGITSRSGGADVLEKLGVPITLAGGAVSESLKRAGAVFLFAPAFHPAFKAVVPVRKHLAERGQSSVFNILGPLLNPARPDFQLSGIYDRGLLETYARIYGMLGRAGGWAVHGEAGPGRGMDEVSSVGSTDVAAYSDGGVTAFRIDPSTLRVPAAGVEQLTGGDAEQNAAIIHGILTGGVTGARRDIVTLNTAAALAVCGLARDLPHGIELAERALTDGRALGVFEAMRAFA